MGRSITYEIGKINIGRKVRYNAGDKGPPCFATLVAAHPKHADVKPSGYSGPPKQIPWAEIEDWTSRNPTPLLMPEPTPAPAPAAKPVVAAKITTVSVPASPSPQATPAQNGTHHPKPDPFAVFGQLSAQLPVAVSEIEAAEGEIDAATEMLNQAHARHAEAVRRLADLRKQLATATAVIDMHLVGTSQANP